MPTAMSSSRSSLMPLASSFLRKNRCGTCSGNTSEQSGGVQPHARPERQSHRRVQCGTGVTVATHLCENAHTIASKRIRGAGASVVQVSQRLQGLLHSGVRFEACVAQPKNAETPLETLAAPLAPR